MDFVLAKKNEADCRLVLDWRNDKETRKASIHSEEKKFLNFEEEYLSYFSTPLLPPLFILFEGQKAGFIYFKEALHPECAYRHVAEISIQIAPNFRKKGLAINALTEIISFIQSQGFDDLFATVKKDNINSIKLFEKAHFQRLTDDFATNEETEEKIPIARFIYPLNKLRVNKVFIIAEAGSNWKKDKNPISIEDKKYAFKMIEEAAKAGADAIKFQVFRPETIYVQNAGASHYLKNAGIENSMQELFKSLSLPYEWLHELAKVAIDNGIEFMASSFSKEDFLAIDPFVKRHKIASYEMSHPHLLKLAAASKKPTLISTGASTEKEIEQAVNYFYKNGGCALTLLQCTAKYPAASSSMHLNTILWLKGRFSCDVGLSDHSIDPILAPIAAVSLGAKVIEKHFTLDKNLEGPDHHFAVEPKELKELVASIREVEKLLGHWKKTVDNEEVELQKFAKRGIQVIQEIKKGDVLQEGINIAILRPGLQSKGINPFCMSDIEGKKATSDLHLGKGLQKGDWE